MIAFTCPRCENQQHGWRWCSRCRGWRKQRCRHQHGRRRRRRSRWPEWWECPERHRWQRRLRGRRWRRQSKYYHWPKRRKGWVWRWWWWRHTLYWITWQRRRRRIWWGHHRQRRCASGQRLHPERNDGERWRHRRRRSDERLRHHRPRPARQHRHADRQRRLRDGVLRFPQGTFPVTLVSPKLSMAAASNPVSESHR